MDSTKPNDELRRVDMSPTEAARVKLPPWNVLLIEDDANARRQILEHFEGHELDGRAVAFHEIGEWDEAFGLIRDRKADLVILDIYRGQAVAGGERVGERVLEEIKRSGFVPVVVYTNLPEGLEGVQNEFVRLVPKLDGLDRLQRAIADLFETRVPPMHRAIVNHLDRALRDYMWGFVAAEWGNLREFASRPEFLRLLLQRLAISFVREGIGAAVAEVFPDYKVGGLDPEKAHPAEFYIKPPIAPDPALGDVRLRRTGNSEEHLVVLWPTCDMVSIGGRKPKTDMALCARASRLDTFPEAREFADNQSNNGYKRLVALMTNNRDNNFGSAERFHFLPGFLDIPSLVVDFQALESLSLNAVKGFRSLGVLASPFAEQFSSRFDRYRGRIGTPDLDCDCLVRQPGEAVQARDKKQVP